MQTASTARNFLKVHSCIDPTCSHIETTPHLCNARSPASSTHPNITKVHFAPTYRGASSIQRRLRLEGERGRMLPDPRAHTTFPDRCGEGARDRRRGSKLEERGEDESNPAAAEGTEARGSLEDNSVDVAVIGGAR